MQVLAHAMIVAAAVGFAAATPAQAAGQPQPVPNEQVSLPPLHLSEQQHEQIRQALKTVHTEFEPNTKAIKPAANFEPKIGAKLPKQLKPTGLPQDLIQKIPALADYGYVKFKGQVLIVNEMTATIVDLMPEA